jgi:hypothetical protein
MANFNWPSITTVPAPIQYELDALPTTVSQDTVTPANSTPLPVINLNTSGVAVNPATEATLATRATEATLATRATESTLSDVRTSVQLIDDIVDTNKARVSVIDPLPAGANNIGDVDVLSLPSLPAGNNNIGDVDVVSLPPLPAGTNNIGDVGVVSLPSLPAGNNNIGDVDVVSLPPLPAGTNNIGDVDVVSLPPLPAGNNNIGDVDVVSLPPLPAGTNNIGDVDVASLPVSFNAGAADATTLRVIPASDYIPPASAVPLALTVKQAAVTVGTSAVRLTTDGLAPSATRRKLQFIVEPGGADNFFMGSSTVTSSGATRGVRVFPGQLYTFDNDAGDYYLVSDTASQTVLILEQE